MWSDYLQIMPHFWMFDLIYRSNYTSILFFQFVSKCGIHNKGGVDIRFASKTSTETQVSELKIVLKNEKYIVPKVLKILWPSQNL